MTFLKLTSISKKCPRRGRIGKYMLDCLVDVLFTPSLFRSKEEKKAEKEQNEAIIEEYGFCTMDGHKEKIGNFRFVFLSVTF